MLKDNNKARWFKYLEIAGLTYVGLVCPFSVCRRMTRNRRRSLEASVTLVMLLKTLDKGTGRRQGPLIWKLESRGNSKNLSLAMARNLRVSQPQRSAGH